MIANIFLNKTKNVHVIPVGLSNQSAVLPFDEDSENLGGSGFNLKIKPSIKLPTQHLKVEKGDTLLEQQKLNIENIPLALIKLDIEGHELSALQGLEKTIRKHQPIILFEAHASKGEHGSEAIFRYLKQHNYTNFYTIEEKKAHPFFLIRFIEKLKGREIVLNQISTPQDRYYSLIIAMTTPLVLE